MRRKQRLIVLPEGTDIVIFLEHDGKPPDIGPTLANAPRQAVTLGHLKERYLTTHANGTLEANSLDTCRLHLGHFARALGEGFPLGELSLAKLQEYVNQRAKAKVSPVTIRKEIATLRAAWNWGEPMDSTSERFPSKGLRYPKADEKPPFMTMEEIERQIDAGGDPDPLWEALYLQADELTELLAYVEKKAPHPWVHPLFCFAAHTGARRSEILRALVADVDFTGNTVLVREKKRSRGQRTTRRVPLTPFLKKVLKEWLAVHPGGSALFCHAGIVARSKKGSRTTGHQNEKKRPSSLKGRMANVKNREQPAQGALNQDCAEALHLRWSARSTGRLDSSHSRASLDRGPRPQHKGEAERIPPGRHADRYEVHHHPTEDVPRVLLAAPPRPIVPYGAGQF